MGRGMHVVRRPRRQRGGRMHVVRRPRRQRGGRMHYVRRRFQKGKGVLDRSDKSGLDFPLLAALAGAGWLMQKGEDSKRKKI